VSGPGVIANNRLKPANAMIMDAVIWQANQIDGPRCGLFHRLTWAIRPANLGTGRLTTVDRNRDPSDERSVF
jgi:hypothetical protein